MNNYSHHPRRILTPGDSRKRKERERETFHSVNKPLKKLTAINPAVSATTSSKVPESGSSNQILAGYMAYEFLTKGTVLGQKFDPARAEAVPVAVSDPRRNKPGPSQGFKQPQSQTYADVAKLMKSDGTHLPGIVNPTQLDRWIKM